LVSKSFVIEEYSDREIVFGAIGSLVSKSFVIEGYSDSETVFDAVKSLSHWSFVIVEHSDSETVFGRLGHWSLSYWSLKSIRIGKQYLMGWVIGH
jgi:hypothetical protein